MVLFKRLEYQFNGYKVPRAARSPRRRAPFKRKSETNHLCAFDLLATVAGKLLLEGESSYSSGDTSTKKEGNAVAYKDHDQQFTDENQLKVETFDQGMENRNSTTLDLSSQVQDQKYGLKESSVVTSSDSFEKANSAENLGKGKEEIGSFVTKIQAGFSDYKELSNHKLEERAQARMKLEPLTSVKASAISGFGAHDIQNRKPLRIGPDFSPRIASDYNYHSSSRLSQDDVKVVRRDDDENSSGCSQPNTEIKAFRSPPRLGDRRIKRLVASKYWNVCSRTKNGELAHSDGDRKNAIRCRKSYFKSEWSQRNYPLKKRKLLYHTTMAESDEGTSDDGILHLLETESNKDVSHSGTGKSNSDSGQHNAVQCRDFCVKLRIKSFRVPELFVEIPETATIGSLKRAVMDGVTAILGGGLHIGVLLQGKKVRDDNKTLRQTGISHDNQLVSDALGFSLEPNLKHPPQPMCTKEPPPLISSDNSWSLTRYLSPSSLVNQGAIIATPDPPVGNLRSFVDSDHDSAPSPTEICLNKRTTYNKTIVPVPSASVEALAVVPVQKKSKHHPESAQRRIRRPFSVSEVEALVQAVEKLGTGRWRDVKLRAFDNAKHRTYVDLKDKWKTLVHTARISPQQRRGEPVPQELLDRVLTAHAYWSQQQAKQQLRQQTETLLLL